MSTSETPSSPLENSYDVVPYPSGAFPQTHPSRLAGMARIFGLAAASPAGARVLELGCGDGSNLLPLAEQLPGATFLGIDSSQVAIAGGQKTLEKAGLKNVELRHASILDFATSEGKFDYIIAHGVFSWVPEPVREKLLGICAEHLTENGVAYVSYNALPGWNMRRGLRDMMLYHTRGYNDPAKRVQQSRALLAFLTESVPTENNAYGLLLKSELEMMKGMPDNYLLHDILGEENTPFYFHEFVGRAAKHGLQYLGEPSLAEMLSINFPEKVNQTLKQLNNQLVAQEQYMDFLRNRSFRQTLLCRSNVALNRAVSPALLSQMAFRSALVRATGPVELIPGVSVGFITAAGVQLNSTDAFVKAMLQTLAETKGVSVIAYRDLLESARARSRPFLGEAPADRDQIDEVTLQTNLMNLLARGFIELYAEPVAVRTDVPEKPAVSALARYQAMNTRMMTNRIHHSVPADAASRYVIAACDGTRNRDEVTAELVARVVEGKLQVNEAGAEVADEQKLKALLRVSVDNALAGLANTGFFAP